MPPDFSRPDFAKPRGQAMAAIQILVGSVMGTAEGVASAVTKELEKHQHQVRINFDATAKDIVESDEDILLICTSNTGSGDLPDNIQPLYLELTRDYPPIAGRRYAVINLGDSSYTTFNEGGRALDAAFSELGAIRLGEPLVLDACDGDDPETLACAWVNTWATTL
jgi:MioC protein